MLDYKAIYRNFTPSLMEEYSYIRNVNTILEIDFPIIFSFESNDKTYLAYVLEFKRIKKKVEMYIVETEEAKLIQFVSQLISLNQILNEKSNTVKCLSFEGSVNPFSEEIVNKLPEDEFYITRLMPNNVDINEYKNMLIEKKKNSELYKEVTSIKYKSNKFKNRKYEKLYNLDRTTTEMRIKESKTSNKYEPLGMLFTNISYKDGISWK